MICPTCKGNKTLLKKEQVNGCYEVVLGICDRCHGTGEIEMTNEEWRTATTKQLAEWLAFLVYEVCICKNGGRGVAEEISKLQKMQNAKE